MRILYNQGQKILLYLYNTPKDLNVISICRALSTTYSYTFKILTEMETLGIVTLTKVNRNKYVNLTEKGNKIAVKFNEIYNILGKQK